MILITLREPHAGHGGNTSATEVIGSERAPRVAKVPARAPMAAVRMEPGVPAAAMPHGRLGLGTAEIDRLGRAGALLEGQAAVDELPVADALHADYSPAASSRALTPNMAGA